jgi:hypothetical protein
MKKVKTRSHDKIWLFFSSKFDCVNFKNTVITSYHVLFTVVVHYITWGIIF